MPHRLLRSAAIAAALAPAVAVSASAETLLDAMRDAYYFEPTIEATRDELRALGQIVPITEAGRLPTLAFVAQQQVNRSITDPANPLAERTTNPGSFGFNGQVPLYDGGRTANEVSEAEANVDAGYARLNDAEQQTLLLTVQVFFDILRDAEVRDLTRLNLRLLNEELEASELRFEVGEVTLTDVAQARARVAEANANVIQAEGALRASAARYAAVVGRLPTGLEPPDALPQLPPSLADAQTEALASHPTIRASRSAERAAIFAIRAAMAGKLPTVDLSASLTTSLSQGFAGDTLFSTGDDDQRDVTAGLTLSLNAPIYQGGRVDSQVRRARLIASQRRSEYHAAVRLVERDLAVSWQSFVSAVGAIEAGVERVRAARIAFEGLREELRVGARSTVDVLDAEEELLAARIALVNQTRERNVAAYAILAAMGRLDPERMGLTPVIDSRTNPQAVIPPNPYGAPQDAPMAWRFPWRP